MGEKLSDALRRLWRNDKVSWQQRVLRTPLIIVGLPFVKVYEWLNPPEEDAKPNPLRSLIRGILKIVGFFADNFTP
jgi:hypothetical protein